LGIIIIIAAALIGLFTQKISASAAAILVAVTCSVSLLTTSLRASWRSNARDEADSKRPAQFSTASAAHIRQLQTDLQLDDASMKTLLERFSIEDIQELGAQVVSESANKGNAAQVQAPTQEVEASRQAPVTQEVEASRQAPVTQEVEASRQAPVRPSLVLRVLSSLAVALLVGTIALLGSYLVLLVIYDPTQTTALIWLRLVGAAFALAAVVLIFAGVSRGELSALLQRIAHGQVVHNA
jgi:hypothetical protein